MTSVYFSATYLSLVLSVQPTVTMSISKPLQITIANTDAMGTSPSNSQHRPLMYLAMQYLRHTYQREFNFTVLDLKPYPDEKSTRNLDDAVVFVGDVYYHNHGISDAITVISSCSADVYQKVGMLTKDLDVLFTCSLGNSGTPKVFPQIITLSLYPVQTLLRAVILLFKHYNWTDIAAIIDEDSIMRQYFHSSMVAAFNVAFKMKDPAVALNSYSVFRCTTQNTLELEGSLRKIAEISRVIFIFGSGRAARAVMMAADKADMTSGEFVFVMSTLNTQDRHDHSWMISPENEAMDLMNQILAHPATLLLSFIMSNTEKSVELLQKDAIKLAWDNDHYIYPRNTVPVQVYTLYEAFLVYGIVLNETYYADSGPIPEGHELAHRYFNRSFRLPTGDIYIDEHGERICDIVAQLYNSTSGNYETVIRYDHIERVLVESNSTGLWLGHWPPPNTPLCGFLVNRCATDGNFKAFTGSVVGGTLAVCLAVVLICIDQLLRWNRRQHWWILSPVLLTRVSAFHTFKRRATKC